jgi:hypothetical protein
MPSHSVSIPTPPDFDSCHFRRKFMVDIRGLAAVIEGINVSKAFRRVRITGMSDLSRSSIFSRSCVGRSIRRTQIGNSRRASIRRKVRKDINTDSRADAMMLCVATQHLARKKVPKDIQP